MDNNLFLKYTKAITKREDDKSIIIALIKESSGIILEKEDFILEGKKITFTTTSTKKMFLKKIFKQLEEKGYMCK
jgi:hypothetical protein